MVDVDRHRRGERRVDGGPKPCVIEHGLIEIFTSASLQRYRYCRKVAHLPGRKGQRRVARSEVGRVGKEVDLAASYQSNISRIKVTLQRYQVRVGVASTVVRDRVGDHRLVLGRRDLVVRGTEPWVGSSDSGKSRNEYCGRRSESKSSGGIQSRESTHGRKTLRRSGQACKYNSGDRRQMRAHNDLDTRLQTSRCSSMGTTDDVQFGRVRLDQCLGPTHGNRPAYGACISHKIHKIRRKTNLNSPKGHFWRWGEGRSRGQS